jgi:hypothetical protein
VRFVAANPHPDHDTIATFRRANKAAFEAAFLQVLVLVRETGLRRLGTVSIDGTKIDANASKLRSLRYDRAQALRNVTRHRHCRVERSRRSGRCLLMSTRRRCRRRWPAARR